MKTSYIVLILFILSCSSKTQEDKNTPGAIEVIDGAKDSLSEGVEKGFLETIKSAKAKNLPQIEKTNFDSFFDEDDYTHIDFKALKLDQVYPDLNFENLNVRAIDMYTLLIRDDYHSVVVTVLKSDNEMESILINYNAEGDIIDHELVSYDEIAEGMSQVVSRISENLLTVNQIYWGDSKEIEQVEYEIRWDGTIEKVDTKNLNEFFEDFELIDKVLTELKLDWVQTKNSMIKTKVYPENPNETFLAIPEIVDEGEQYFELNSHIIIADNQTGKITHQFFESNQTNQWVSDAIELREINIDTAQFQLSEKTKAYGLQVDYLGMSRVNPYSNKTLSLFIKSGDKLKKILSNYSIKDFGGEWDGNCDGEFESEEKIVFLSPNKTKGYFDLLVNKKISETRNYQDEDEECQSENSYQIKNTILKFDGTKYIEVEDGFESKSYPQIHPKKLENLQQDNFHIDQAYELNGQKIITGNYIPEKGKHYTSSTESQFEWGDRLLLLDSENDLVFQSLGFGDLYHFEPHFYTAEASNKIIIICQKAFEYPFGGEVFILEENAKKHVGTLDIEGNEEKDFLTEIVEIHEVESSLVFAIKSNYLMLKPGEEFSTKVSNAIYVYQGNQLVLKTNTP
ncbi:hypothetical protein [Algoriphagus zhangzhouensis]|uniref:Uncharacterized protein n=1 Tax=Algoriphagus zhangzhouensis TaxID=1073327 RepID=A0A1M7ZHK8_9BACT|nr:hypothetical protein [Algoriphagus zhangzhouensis]TDY44161.1 hypothetical protein A8938_3372 [Algoriphagus zhangzhouensis]SHO64312.1 hypothetical protein SAMN04488108_3367 [Algoriphagus zhangzhouensis]